MKLGRLNIDKLPNVLLIIGCVYYITNCGGSKEIPVIPEGYISPKEFDYRMQVIDLIKTNQNLEYEIQGFKDKYEADTASINNADKHELLHLITDRYR